jgi:biopolymer transport protein ExbD
MMLKRGHAAHDFELNLTPIIDCFVTLICFLLLSATYVNLVGMDAKVPVAVATSSTAADNEPKFKLELTIRRDGIELNATGAGKATGRKHIANLKGALVPYDLVALHNELVRIKHERPKEFSINFNSAIDMKYEDLVRFMDVTRNLDPKDGNFTMVDERNGKTMKVDVLFPDFVISNLGAVAEGKGSK